MSEEIRKQVKQFYGNIAKDLKEGKASCCCGNSCCTPIANASLLYHPDLLGDLPEEILMASQGCANPLVFAELKEGDVVLDLGSGGGIDVILASKLVGLKGKVYGLDMTDEMLALAEQNKSKAGVANAEFLKGFIEDIPLPDGSVDVVISNCVINLSADKEKVFREIYRVLKSGGRVAIADIVALKTALEDLRKSTELLVSCVAGALYVEDYKKLLAQAGFNQIDIYIEHVYTKDIIGSLVGEDVKLEPADLDRIDGAFGSAIIKAVK